MPPDEKSSSTPATRRPIRGLAGNYLRHRVRDIVGKPFHRQPLDRLFDRAFGRSVEDREPALPPPASGEDTPAGTPWTGAVKRRYEHDALAARALFSGTAVSVLIFVHRVLLADAAGAGASLGMAFTLAAFALGPAYRCWRLRAGPSGDPRAFLRRPSAWWPGAPPDRP